MAVPEGRSHTVEEETRQKAMVEERTGRRVTAPEEAGRKDMAREKNVLEATARSLTEDTGRQPVKNSGSRSMREVQTIWQWQA